jgi:hypothetical protein
MTTFAYTYDKSLPTGSQRVPVLDDELRNLKAAVQERENVDHFWGLTATAVSDSDTGKHRKVTFYGVLTVKPTLETGEGALYIKTVSAVSELFFEDSGGTEIQLTTGGKFNVASGTIPADSITQAMIRLANNSNLVALNAAGLAEINLIKANASDKPEIPDGAVLATSGAPVVDAGIANKLYVDTQVATKGSFISGSVVFNNYCSAANTWQDLDLSAQVGAKVAMVYLEVTGAAAMYVAVKPKGYGGIAVNHTSSGDLGASQGYMGSKYCYMMCMTNASGVIQIAANQGGNAAWTITMKLIGYVV